MSEERSIQSDDVRREQEAAIKQPLQWAYLAGVLVGGTLLMLMLIAFLGYNGG